MTQALDLLTGRPAGNGAAPEAWKGGETAAAIYRELARLGRYDIPGIGADQLSAEAMVDLRLDGMGMHYRADTGQNFPSLDAMRTITRTGVAYSPNWSFRSGDPVGNLDEYPANALRFNQPENAQGATLVEPAGASNYIEDPRFETALNGATTGTGRISENAVLFVNGLTWTVRGRGVEKGSPYVEIELSGTATGSQSLYFEPLNGIAAAQGQSWSLSFGVRVISGTLPGTLTALIVERDSGQVFLDSSGKTGVADTKHRRFTQSRTLTQASTAYVNAVLQLASASGAVACVFRIYAPQMEQSAAATSPILPPEDAPGVSVRGAETVSWGLSFSRNSRGWASKWDWTNGGELGALKEFLSNVPRQGEWGLYSEPESTNLVRNPRCLNPILGVVGSGGAMPTHMGGGGIAQEVKGFGEEDGIPYVELEVAFTAGGQSTIVQFDTLIAVLPNSNYATTVGLRAISGNFASLANVLLRFDTYDSGINYITTFNSAELKTLVDRKRRRFLHRIATGGAAAHAYAYVQLFSSAAGTFRYRLYAPQVENRREPTSIILPEPGTTGTSTRAAENLTFDVNLEGNGRSLYVEGFRTGDTSGVTRWVASLYDDANNFGGYNITDNLLYYDEYNGAYFASSNPQGVGLGTPFAAAYGYAANDMAFSRNGVAQATDVTGSNSITGAKLAIGGINTTANSPGMCLTALRLFDARLSNAELERLVGN